MGNKIQVKWIDGLAAWLSPDLVHHPSTHNTVFTHITSNKYSSFHISYHLHIIILLFLLLSIPFTPLSSGCMILSPSLLSMIPQPLSVMHKICLFYPQILRGPIAGSTNRAWHSCPESSGGRFTSVSFHHLLLTTPPTTDLCVVKQVHVTVRTANSFVSLHCKSTTHLLWIHGSTDSLNNHIWSPSSASAFVTATYPAVQLLWFSVRGTVWEWK